MGIVGTCNDRCWIERGRASLIFHPSNAAVPPEPVDRYKKLLASIPHAYLDMSTKPLDHPSV